MYRLNYDGGSRTLRMKLLIIKIIFYYTPFSKMNKLIKVGGAVAVIVGMQIALLGALYKIQSWESPYIGDLKLNLLFLGLVLTFGGIAALVIAGQKKEEQMELDPNHIPREKEKVEELLRDDDQYV